MGGFIRSLTSWEVEEAREREDDYDAREDAKERWMDRQRDFTPVEELSEIELAAAAERRFGF